MGSIGAGYSRTYRDFSSILDYSAYDPLPEDWLLGITDVVDSGLAIGRGAYRDVNYAGASVIAAIGNALGTHDFPFTFGGDGAAFAIPARGSASANATLEQVIAWTKTDLGLTLRGGLIPVREIRAQGHDVRIAKYAASEHAAYSMFAGGGLTWAERELKKGRYLISPASTSSKPDLTGLNCEWAPIHNHRGIILSLLIEPCENTDSKTFATLARRVLAVFDADLHKDHSGAAMGATRLVPGLKECSDPQCIDPQSQSEIASNSDSKKYDDLLRLTLDCSEEQARMTETILLDARARGQINFGMHRQTHALVTCLVPSGNPTTHLHFLDGMDGGYAKASDAMKSAARLRD